MHAFYFSYSFFYFFIFLKKRFTSPNSKKRLYISYKLNNDRVTNSYINLFCINKFSIIKLVELNLLSHIIYFYFILYFYLTNKKKLNFLSDKIYIISS